MNFCKDCAHLIRKGDPRNEWHGEILCALTEHANPVSSEPNFYPAWVARLDLQPCGPDGRMFEPRITEAAE